MKVAFFILILSAFNLVHAQQNECLKRIGEELETESEKHLFSKHPSIVKVFDLNCEDSELGNSLYTRDTFVFVHEAAHFEDLGWDGNNVLIDMTNPAKNFDLFTVDNQHIGNFQSYEKLPLVKDLIRPYLEKEKPDFLKEDSIYMGMHDGYIGAEDSMAAEIIQGMATELNGYTHGTLTQVRSLAKLPSDNPYVSMPVQIDGILYFLYNFNLYFKLLKQHYPEIWEEFYLANKAFLKKALSPSIQVLKKINHCALKPNYAPVNFYVEELKADDLSAMEDILGADEMGILLCAGN